MNEALEKATYLLGELKILQRKTNDESLQLREEINFLKMEIKEMKDIQYCLEKYSRLKF